MIHSTPSFRFKVSDEKFRATHPQAITLWAGKIDQGSCFKSGNSFDALMDEDYSLVLVEYRHAHTRTCAHGRAHALRAGPVHTFTYTHTVCDTQHRPTRTRTRARAARAPAEPTCVRVHASRVLR